MISLTVTQGICSTAIISGGETDVTQLVSGHQGRNVTHTLDPAILSRVIRPAPGMGDCDAAERTGAPQMTMHVRITGENPEAHSAVSSLPRLLVLLFCGSL